MYIVALFHNKRGKNMLLLCCYVATPEVVFSIFRLLLVISVFSVSQQIPRADEEIQAPFQNVAASKET